MEEAPGLTHEMAVLQEDEEEEEEEKEEEEEGVVVMAAHALAPPLARWPLRDGLRTCAHRASRGAAWTAPGPYLCMCA